MTDEMIQLGDLGEVRRTVKAVSTALFNEQWPTLRSELVPPQGKDKPTWKQKRKAATKLLYECRVKARSLLGIPEPERPAKDETIA